MTKTIPFDFVFDYLPDNIIAKPMFGMYSLYIGNRIVLILHKREKYPAHNGIWVAIMDGHHQRLKSEVPSLVPILKENDKSCAKTWLLLKEEADDFESTAIRICELIAHGDPGIGRIPKTGR
jgi:hypothetical protein